MAFGIPSGRGRHISCPPYPRDLEIWVVEPSAGWLVRDFVWILGGGFKFSMKTINQMAPC